MYKSSDLDRKYSASTREEILEDMSLLEQQAQDYVAEIERLKEDADSRYTDEITDLKVEIERLKAANKARDELAAQCAGERLTAANTNPVPTVTELVTENKIAALQADLETSKLDIERLNATVDSLHHADAHLYAAGLKAGRESAAGIKT